MKNLVRILAGAAALAAASPAAAAATSVVAGKCTLGVTGPKGCLFNGNINGVENTTADASYLNAEAVYNALSFDDIDLKYFSDFGPDAGGNSNSLGSISGAGSSGTWTTNGQLVDFMAVKAGNYFVLYQFSAPTSSGSWNTFDIPTNGKARSYKGISHVVFFTRQAPPVPEPATWALMILGFGTVGAAMRRKRQTLALA